MNSVQMMLNQEKSKDNLAALRPIKTILYYIGHNVRL